MAQLYAIARPVCYPRGVIAFRVQRNDDAAVTAELSGQQTTTVVVTSSAAPSGCDLKVHVGGIRRLADGSRNSLVWVETDLRVGDTVDIAVVDVAEVDPPASETPGTELIERSERAELKRLLEKYGT
jgi:hypothetical protein